MEHEDFEDVKRGGESTQKGLVLFVGHVVSQMLSSMFN